MQGNNRNMNAETLVPILLSIQLADDKAAIRDRFLVDWDMRNDMDSQAALVFENFWWFLLQDTFNDQLPDGYQAAGGSRWYEVMRTIANDPTNTWWDDQTTADKVETRDELFVNAFDKAVANLESFNGKDPAKWDAWGDWHTSTFRNATLGNSGIAPIENLFNRGKFPTAGGEGIVNATGWDVGDSFEVNWLPSMRMIVDLGDLNNSLTVHTTGESGHAYHPHYIDMADLWRNIQYYPMLWNEQAVVNSAESHLILVP
jgi:penicillin amidase